MSFIPKMSWHFDTLLSTGALMIRHHRSGSVLVQVTALYCQASSHYLNQCWFVINKILHFNSLAPGRFQWNLRKIIFKLILVTDGCDISSEIALRWTSLDLSDNKSTLVQVMAWCHQATSHYLNQCWPRSLPPYGVTKVITAFENYTFKIKATSPKDTELTLCSVCGYVKKNESCFYIRGPFLQQLFHLN